MYTNLCYITNWYIMVDFQTLNCCYSFRIQAMWPKLCMALVTRYDLLPLQNLEPSKYLSLFWIYSRHYIPVALLLCCGNIKDWSISFKKERLCEAAVNNSVYYTSRRFNELWLAESYATYAILDSVLLEVSIISHMVNIGQETAQHLSRDLLFIVSDKMTPIKYFFCRIVQGSFCTLTLHWCYLYELTRFFKIKTLFYMLVDSCLTL